MKKIIISLVAFLITTHGYAIVEQNFDKGSAMKNYKVVSNPSIQIVGIECRTSNHADAGPLDIPLHWAKFYSENILSKIPNKTSDDVVALYCDYEGDYTQPYSLVLGCQTSSIDQIPEGMVAKVIPASSYAVFNAIGNYPKSLIETWKLIWQSSLKRTYTGDFEIYGNKFLNSSPKEVEVYIAIDPKN